MKQSERTGKILSLLAGRFGLALTELKYSSPFELLVATILSAQCTDLRVNRVTPILFGRYPTPKDLAGADLEEVEEIIRPTGFFKSKTRAITSCAAGLVERFGGEVPSTMEELVTLPGVGRKTANVILGNAFGRPAIVVDTHVRRVSRRLGLTSSADPGKIEMDLARLIPQGRWTEGSHHLLLHGRYICTARLPRCLECPIDDLCPAETEKAAARKPSSLTFKGRRT